MNIQVYKGKELDSVGHFYGLHRTVGEDDSTFRKRVINMIVTSSGTSQSISRQLQSAPTPPPQVSWKFDVTNIVDINGTDYKIMSKEYPSWPNPHRYVCMDMDSGSKHHFEKDAVEKFELSKSTFQPQHFPGIRKFATVNPLGEFEYAELTSDGQEWTMDKDVAYENRCRHTQTKLNHAGGIVFKQCCHCKEDLGDA